ncbi:unnamed protein product [Urochloa humidicola]
MWGGRYNTFAAWELLLGTHILVSKQWVIQGPVDVDRVPTSPLKMARMMALTTTAVKCEHLQSLGANLP